MKINIAQVMGLNTDQKASQVISVSQEENTFLAVLDLTCDDAFTKGRQVLSELSDYYFEFEGSPSDKLNACFTEAGQKLPQEALPAGRQESSLLIASVSGKILYLIGKGEVEANLKREQKLSPLLSVGSSSQLISGFLTEGDKLLLSTKTLIDFLGESLEESLKLPMETFEEDISARIGASELENGGLAGLLVEVTVEQDKKMEEEQREESIPVLEEEQPDVREKKAFNLSLVFNIAAKVKSILVHYFPRSGRGKLILAVILIIVIGLGVGFKIKISKDAQKEASFKEQLQQAKDDFNQALGLATLNPTEAKSKLDSAKNKLDSALKLKPGDNEAQSLKKQIENDSASILQESTVSDFPLFLDMDLVKKDFRATQMSLSSGKLLLLDPGVKTLVMVDLAKKSNQILAGSDKLGEAGIASLNGGLAFVYSKDNGILKIDSSNQKLTTVAKKDDDWGNIKDLYAFAGNIYILDSGNPPAGGQIWKYLAISDGYSDKREYLAKETKVDLSNSLRMQIESSVYVLKQGGEILRFTRGVKDNFSLGGLPSPVKDPKSFFVSSETDNLYLLDSGNSRLLILTKTGEYKGIISGAKFASSTDLAVDEKGKKVYLLEGSKIFQVDLK